MIIKNCITGNVIIRCTPSLFYFQPLNGPLKRFSEKFRKTHKKTYVLESLL